jgi:hypothetical protein
MIFVFSQPDPFTFLRPQIPMLTPEDWPGSSASLGLGISTAWRWQEKREFHTELSLDAGAYAAGIGQIAIWYADPFQAAADWKMLDQEFHKEESFVTSTGGDGQPETMLFCGSAGMSLPDGFRECWYLALWKHWYTEVNYRSELADDLHMVEMQKIAARVNQLLVSASDEPCYGVLCTGTKSEAKP